MTSAELPIRRVGTAVSSLWSADAWRATRNGLAAMLAAAVSTLVLGGLTVVWGAAVISLVNWPVGGWGHVLLYSGVVIAGPALALLAVQGLTALQRSRLDAVNGLQIGARPQAAHQRPWPVGHWLTAATWRQVGFHLLSVFTGAAAGLVAACWLAPAGAIVFLAAAHPAAITGAAVAAAAAVALLAAPWLARQVTRADQAMAVALLGPSSSEQLQLRLESIARSRADLVAAADTERRRIERDLHDGAQQRLVSLAMKLGMAREEFAGAAEPVRLAIAEAHDEAVLALAELREFIRGLYPAVLSDRGLDAALSGLAARVPLPVSLRVDVPVKASPSIEAVAYFMVSETLANVAKHARATQAEVIVTRAGTVLKVVVKDNGIGGALPGDDRADQTGLRGLAQRAASVDGTLTIDSPPGGPTVIIAELPCES
jgi:signal transduction histidine kinase